MKKTSCTRCGLDISAKDSPRQKIRDYADGCYMHGPSAIARSVNVIRMTMWILVFCTGWGMTCWQLTTLIQKFYTYPTSTNLLLNSNGSMVFPAVTVCNNNPVLKSKLGSTGSALQKVIDDSMVTEAPALTDWESVDDNASFYNEWDDTAAVNHDFTYNYAGLSLDKKKAAGHQLYDMLVKCTFKGKSCSPENFTNFVHYKFGNCYTFNSGVNGTALSATEKTGPIYGLAMEFYLQQDDYVPAMSPEAAMRLTIHNQTSMPFPEESGIYLAPGFKTSIAMRMTQIIRAEPEYGDCKTFTRAENRKINAWADVGDLDIDYSYVACQKTCYQQSMIQYCGCCSLDYPCYSSAFDVVKEPYGNQPIGFCDFYSNLEQYTCEQEVLAKYESGTLPCSSTCVPPCDETEYATEASMAAWPSDEYLNTAITDFKSSSSALWFSSLTAASTTEEKRDFMNKNGVKVEIYFRYLNYQVIKTEPSYLVENLLSDIGGQLGLWIGLSIVSLFEVIEIISDLVGIGILRLCNKKKNGIKSVDFAESGNEADDSTSMDNMVERQRRKPAH